MTEMATDTVMEEKNSAEALTTSDGDGNAVAPSDDVMMSEEDEREKMLKAARQSMFSCIQPCS
jgi:hypothetical protein